MGDNINAIKKITVTLIDASKEVGLEINAKKTYCHLIIRMKSQDKESY
jgi:hypothetical protein